MKNNITISNFSKLSLLYEDNKNTKWYLIFSKVNR